MLIESRQNPQVKRVKQLHAGKGRQELGLHVIEGEKLLREAVRSGAQIEDVFVREGIEVSAELIASVKENVYTVTQPVMEALCDTVTPQGICATVRTPSLMLPEQYPTGMLVALDTLQDPGNLGTILRTADAMGASGILLSADCVDPYSPKAIRAAVGATYHLPIWKGNLYEALQGLHHDGYCCICGHLQGKVELPSPKDRCVIVIGNEGNGVHENIAALCALVRLPMSERAESLNASVAAGILMYEVAKNMHTVR